MLSWMEIGTFKPTKDLLKVLPPAKHPQQALLSRKPLEKRDLTLTEARGHGGAG